MHRKPRATKAELLPPALIRLQLRIRENVIAMEEPKISVARAFADSFLPQTKEGRLYKAIGLPEPWRKWRDGAPVTMEVFDKMGVNIGVYMRLVYGCIPLFFFLSIVSLVPICYNLAGTYEVDNTLLSAHTLGNARQLLALQGVFDFICVITMMAAIAKGTQVLRDASERIEPRRANQLSAANYTLLVRGLPRSNQLQASELRALFEHWGEVVSVAIARANSALIKLVRERQDLSFKLTQKRICASRLHKKAKTPQERAAAAARGAPSPKDERRLQYLNGEIGKLRKEVFPSTGICFVTFNEQRAAHACLLKLRERPQASIAGEFVNLQAEFAPSPDNLIWENLEVGACSRWLRRWLVNSILIVQCIVSTLAITAVTNRSVEKGLDDTAGFFEKIFTTAWTTVIIILSNLSIFILAPIYMDKIERDHTQDLRETALAGKLLIFQVFNGMAAALSFLWTKDGGIKGIFDHEWYSVGAPTVINVLIADALIINLAVEGFRIFDALPIRLLLAPRARTQAEMNKLYAVTNPLYLPFRMQLTLKFFVFGIGFAYGIPVLYPLTLLFFLVSWVTDRSGLLRVFHGILVTTDKLVILLGMIDTCPWALVLHCFLAFLMAHSFEVAEQQLTPDGGAFVAFRELDQTVPNFSVGLSLALLGLSLLFALVFVTREKAIRRARKERRLRLFSRLPKLGTPAFAQLKSKFKVKVRPRSDAQEA